MVKTVTTSPAYYDTDLIKSVETFVVQDLEEEKKKGGENDNLSAAYFNLVDYAKVRGKLVGLCRRKYFSS